MSSASHPEGLAIARELIAREAEARPGLLDLGGLGLRKPEPLVLAALAATTIEGKV